MGRRKKEKQLDLGNAILTILISLILILEHYYGDGNKTIKMNNGVVVRSYYINLEEIPEYTDEAYVAVNENKPYFKE